MASATEAGPRRLAAAMITVLAVAAAVGVLSAIRSHDEEALPTDYQIVTSDFVFEPDTLEVQAGPIGLHVANADATRHDLTIDGVVTIDVPGHRSRRAVLHIDAGRHVFTCTLHPTMTGILNAADLG